MGRMKELVKVGARAAMDIERRWIAPHRSVRLPEFLGIGPAQSGTTWLFRNLDSHPQVGIPIKEVTYWSNLTHRSIYWYARLVASPKPFLGEITPRYFLLDRRTIRAIHRLTPEVRLIMMLRDPVDRAWSAFRRKRLSFEEPTPETVDRFLESERRAPNLDFIDWGDYRRALDNWLTVFSRQQLFPVPFSRIVVDPSALLREVSQHIGIDPSYEFPYVDKKINPNPEAEMPHDVRSFLKERYRGQREAVIERLGVAW